MKTDLERLLAASIAQVEMQKKLDAAHAVVLKLKRRNDTLEAENQILRARLRLVDIKILKASDLAYYDPDLPALLRRQAGGT